MSELTLIIALVSIFLSVITLFREGPMMTSQGEKNVPIPMVIDVPGSSVLVLQTDELFIDGTEFDICYARIAKALHERKPIILPANWSISFINIKEEKSEKPSNNPVDAPG